jgi:hypothetical protein
MSWQIGRDTILPLPVLYTLVREQRKMDLFLLAQTAGTGAYQVLTCQDERPCRLPLVGWERIYTVGAHGCNDMAILVERDDSL